MTKTKVVKRDSNPTNLGLLQCECGNGYRARKGASKHPDMCDGCVGEQDRLRRLKIDIRHRKWE